MLYIRSSFIKYLTSKFDCQLIPLRDGKGLRIYNGIAQFNMFMTPTIDMEEIISVCLKLYLEIPTEKELQRAE